MWTALNLRVDFGRLAAFRNEHGRSVHLLLSSSIIFFSVLKFSVERSIGSLVRFIPMLCVCVCVHHGWDCCSALCFLNLPPKLKMKHFRAHFSKPASSHPKATAYYILQKVYISSKRFFFWWSLWGLLCTEQIIIK